MQYTVLIGEAFDRWLRELKDSQGAAAIARRIRRAESGNFGAHRSVGGGLSEMKIDKGPGYRVYYTIRKRFIVFVLCGGDKSTQESDIKAAKKLADGIS